MLTRRAFLTVNAALAAIMGGSRLSWGAPPPSPTEPSIAMEGTPKGEDDWFDPVGLWVPPGTVIRWFVPADQTQKHDTVAYDPSNYDRPRRIPPGATPWDSHLLSPGQTFEVQLTVEGVYDYFCRPHEEAGMVGRIIVGRPSGHDLEDYAAAAQAHPEWRPVPEAALKVFPSIGDILRRKVIPHLPT